MTQHGPDLALQFEQTVEQLARELPRFRWDGDLCALARQATLAYARGDAQLGDELVERGQARLRDSWGTYYGSPIQECEVSAEAVAGHRLLERAVNGGRSALAELQVAAEAGLDPAPALSGVEQASRLLVALQQWAVSS